MRVLELTAARLLRPGGLLIAEHADVQADAAPGVFQRTGRWSNVEDHLDLAGRPRYVTATLTTATGRA
jgi:release factor glutamine methyltransferase